VRERKKEEGKERENEEIYIYIYIYIYIISDTAVLKARNVIKDRGDHCKIRMCQFSKKT
jgi:hypothetical protein